MAAGFSRWQTGGGNLRGAVVSSYSEPELKFSNSPKVCDWLDVWVFNAAFLGLEHWWVAVLHLMQSCPGWISTGVISLSLMWQLPNSPCLAKVSCGKSTSARCRQTQVCCYQSSKMSSSASSSPVSPRHAMRWDQGIHRGQRLIALAHSTQKVLE